ncbi:Major sperm protein [Aphelenchoides bicaudatus]|nr:Major sperm protein [Aphelenchoides bicaudatus]
MESHFYLPRYMVDLLEISAGENNNSPIKDVNLKRFGVDQLCGVLDPMETVLIAFSGDAFQCDHSDINDDRITIEWINTPEGAAKQFCHEWFQGDCIIRRKNLPIEYNC